MRDEFAVAAGPHHRADEQSRDVVAVQTVILVPRNNQQTIVARRPADIRRQVAR